jgi:hypothetical protein
VRRHENADLIGDILDDVYPNPPIPLDHRDLPKPHGRLRNPAQHRL